MLELQLENSFRVKQVLQCKYQTLLRKFLNFSTYNALCDKLHPRC